MRIALDKQPGSPLYLQICDFLTQAITAGTLSAGTRLPSIRGLAADLGVSRITVENAYARLEAEGLVASQVGSGTYVLPGVPLAAAASRAERSNWPVWQQGPLARSKRSQQDSAFRHLADSGNLPDPIYFSGGIGDPALFPVRDFGRVIQRVIRRDGMDGLCYGEPSGFMPLRRTISQIMTSLGIRLNPENILITTGSQQAISLVVQAVLRSGDTVVVEEPTYNGALDLFEALHITPIGIPIDENGMCVERLETVLQTYHPKLIYTIPNFQNPSGVCMSGSRRRALLALALRYNIPILEDDYVGDLRYEGCAQPALKSLDPCGSVIYVSTFSKMLMPDLRVGFLAADGPIYDTLVNLKCLNDLATSNLMQRALHAFLSVGSYQSHLRKTIRIFKKRREAMVKAAVRHLDGLVEFTVPRGGLFLWLRIVRPVDSSRLIEQAIKTGVGFAPGRGFFIDKARGDSYLRLNFAYQTETSIEKGIQRLAAAIAAMV